MLGLLVLPLAAPSSAKFYSGDLQEPENREVTQKHFSDLDLHSRSAYEPGNKARPIYRSWQGHNFTDEDKEKDKEKQLATKQAQKIARNSTYGEPGSKSSKGSSASGSKGGSIGGGSKNGGSKGGPTSYDKGSKGSKTGKWLSNEKRKRQKDTFKQIMRDKHPRGSRGSKGSAQPRPGQHGKPVQYKPAHWDISRFKHLDKDFWSKDDFDKAMLCWLAPHLHEDKEFVNRYWNKWGYKWKWMHKYYKHKFHKHKHDKPSEVPLPSSVVLLGSALLGMAAIGRRRRH